MLGLFEEKKSTYFSLISYARLPYFMLLQACGVCFQLNVSFGLNFQIQHSTDMYCTGHFTDEKQTYAAW